MVATQIFFIFTPKIGEDEPILTFIFFKGVGSTTNKTMISFEAISRIVLDWCRIMNFDIHTILISDR